MLRTGTGLPIPEELLHSGEVARGPQPLAADGTRERLERDLGTPPVVHVARETGQPQQHTSRPTIAAGKQIVEHRFRPLGESRRRRIRGRGVEVAGDRKSTRLNSSHLVISYAVFCLKKKKREYVLTSI